VFRDELDDVLDRRDIIFLWYRAGSSPWLRIERSFFALPRAPLKRSHLSRADSDEVLTVITAIDEDE
jgi:hypothetical protein